MTSTLSDRLDRVLKDLPRNFPGPGGAVAVLRAGEVLEKRAWGYANAELRVPFSTRSLFRMCSITKQFTCALVLDAFPDPSALDADVRRHLPRMEGPVPPAARLCHNQSGLRDYWAVAMLHGSPAEAPFGDAEAHRVIAGEQTLHFPSGTRFSYCNQNFRILSDILEERTGRSFAELLHTRIFDRAGMGSAILAADTRAMPDATEGYEGDVAVGFRPAVNRIVWTGDAGLGASMDDMIAWERHIDATREDPNALYGRLSVPVTFNDGTKATYGFGLGRSTEFGRALTSHGGGLRGWSSQRLYMPAERISVVIMLNHLSDASSVAPDVLAALLGETRPKPDATLPAPGWLGAYVEPETGLAVRIDSTVPGQVRLRYGPKPEQLDLQPDGSARSPRGATLRADGDSVRMDRPGDNLSSRLRRLEGEATKDVAGQYRCAELDAEITVADAGGMMCGAFSGFLGQGRMEMLEPVGPDVWMIPCPRALDHTAPGDWTLAFRRDGGRVVGIEVGCWLARGLKYERV
jgi:D-aminopeptidase